jgi:uncharacterized protein
MRHRFRWDDAKAASNIWKHGITFEEAASAFADPFFRIFPDSAHSFGENRFVLVGRSDLNRLVVVVHVERSEDKIRIITARLATRRERFWYEEGR